MRRLKHLLTSHQVAARMIKPFHARPHNSVAQCCKIKISTSTSFEISINFPSQLDHFPTSFHNFDSYLQQQKKGFWLLHAGSQHGCHSLGKYPFAGPKTTSVLANAGFHMPVYDCHLPKGLIIETAIYERKITIGVISHASSQKKPAISYPILIVHNLPFPH